MVDKAYDLFQNFMDKSKTGIGWTEIKFDAESQLNWWFSVTSKGRNNCSSYESDKSFDVH